MVYIAGDSDEGTTAAGPHDAFVAKPFTAQALLGAMRRAMGTRARSTA